MATPAARCSCCSGALQEITNNPGLAIWRCEACGGYRIHAEEPVLRRIVNLDEWAEPGVDITGPEVSYFDVSTPRRSAHGWYHRPSGKIVQAG